MKAKLIFKDNHLNENLIKHYLTDHQGTLKKTINDVQGHTYLHVECKDPSFWFSVARMDFNVTLIK